MGHRSRSPKTNKWTLNLRVVGLSCKFVQRRRISIWKFWNLATKISESKIFEFKYIKKKFASNLSALSKLLVFCQWSMMGYLSTVTCSVYLFIYDNFCRFNVSILRYMSVKNICFRTTYAFYLWNKYNQHIKW